MLHDESGLAAAQASPGLDPRCWVSYGLVDQDTPSARSVLFKDEQGNPLPFPMVLVTLQPSGVTLACRVAGQVAGTEEGEWFPFVAGDEVVVAVVQGDEREGGVILGRLNQSKDTFPQSVAGNDTTSNTFAFRRRLPAVVEECGTSFLFRLTTTGSFLAIDRTGNVTAQSADGHYINVSHDFVGMQLKNLQSLVQINATTGQVFLQAGASQLLLDPQGQNQMLTTGVLGIGTAGSQPQWHAATTEAVLLLLQSLGAILVLGGPTPLTSASLGALLATPAALAAIVSGTAAIPFDTATLGAAVLAALAKGTQLTPNVGIPGLLLG